VTVTKDNIMKLGDGLFHKKFDEIAKEYPEIGKWSQKYWYRTALVAERPEIFDVMRDP